MQIFDRVVLAQILDVATMPMSDQRVAWTLFKKLTSGYDLRTVVNSGVMPEVGEASLNITAAEARVAIAAIKQAESRNITLSGQAARSVLETMERLSVTAEV